MRFRSYVDGAERFLGPETSMATQAALHSDIALVLDECTPFHAGREYWARSMERTHRWLERCLDWHAEHGPGDQLVYGIVQGGTDPRAAHDLGPGDRREPRGRRGDRRLARAGQSRDARGRRPHDRRAAAARARAPAPPAGDRRHRRPAHRRRAGDRHVRLRDADAARPPRGRDRPGPGPALARWTSFKGRFRDSHEPILDGCPCPACARGFTRGYLHYLLRAHEVTGLRLITQHNLSFIARLMADLRAAIDAGTLEQTAAAVQGGAAPSARARRLSPGSAGHLQPAM